MEDYLSCLFDYVLNQRLPHAKARADFLSQSRREESASQELCLTFTPEQQRLYLACEEARNALQSTREELLFREAFRLAREIYTLSP